MQYIPGGNVELKNKEGYKNDYMKNTTNIGGKAYHIEESGGDGWREVADEHTKARHRIQQYYANPE